MVLMILVLGLASFLIAVPMCALMIRVGHTAGAVDTAAMPGQLKGEHRAIPNTGGVGIVGAIAVPMLVILGAAWFVPPDSLGFLGESVTAHRPGLRAWTPRALGLLGCVGGLHVMGLIDDRRPLGAVPKLLVMLVPALIAATLLDTRLLTLLDGRAGGAWLSIVITAVWFVAITNAMNFIDNMDGLSAGAAAIAGGCFLAAALIEGQWFVAAMLALLVGACLGFLVFNFPRAKLFMGDGGSLVLGFLLAFLTARTTYFGGAHDRAWYGVLMPVAVLAIPLYDLVSVTLIRLARGRSPLVGDLSHLSHRLVDRGLSKPVAVVAIWGCTLITGLVGVMLGSLSPWQAGVAGGIIVLLLGVLAMMEWGTRGAGGDE